MRSDLSDEASMIRWLRGEGDALLRTCYLLCGDLPMARRIARWAFTDAWMKRNAPPVLDEHAALLSLLREAMRLCPCRKALILPFSRRDAALRLRRLPPNPRCAALLCLYHGLSAQDAARVLERDEALVLRDLHRALKLLNIGP